MTVREMGTIPCRRRDLFLLSVCTLTIFIWLQLHHLNNHAVSGAATHWTQKSQTPIQSPTEAWQQDPNIEDERNKAANATLGFGRIIAVSTRTSHRRTSLSISADLTGLEISIPDQPAWTDADLANFKAKNKSMIKKGSALAWMGHLNALRWFMTQPYETAVIIEDDINWDIHLRTKQAPLLARGFHDLLEREMRTNGYIRPVKDKDHNRTTPWTPIPKPSTLELKSKAISSGPYQRTAFWPDSKYWEILHLGHCGDFYPADKLSHILHNTYPDPNMPSPTGLHIDTQRFLNPLGIPPRHRLIHQSLRPLCTFAYAVTKESARKILEQFSTEEENHGTAAYDVRILEACRDLGFKCWSANPELFHHLDDQASEIANVNGPKPAGIVARKEEFGVPDEPPPSAEDTARARARGTPNVACGIRTLVERLGASRNVREMVRLAGEMDGMCPITVDELDLMRGQIVEKGRSNLPVG
ncbi:hypothetical protein BT63DRAFT_451970 [Microthyrium microscopicum]|uniref:Glycosyltransferase family 25 protein n=1 Tax=Microthyrium microscopicum TaxID=703497 RepID=A0A6A6UNP8_9PEZI|nr:hypothetical protein BT63DRAFT_451970 [Microthyrium microscopicum]